MPLLLALVASVPFAVVLWRRPVLRRLALRNAARRPGEALLVVLGSMFGTAIITGTLVVGDTVDGSVRGLAHTRLGPIDELVATPDAGRHEQARQAAESARSDLVDGVLALSRLPVTAAVGVDDARRAAPRSQILEFDFAAARGFGGDPAATGVSGDTPAHGHAVITDALADELDAGAGDEVAVFAYGRQQVFAVDRVLPVKGVAGFVFGFFNARSRNVLVAPGTIDELAAGAVSGDEAHFAPPTRIVAVSNTGGVEDGARHTDAVLALLEPALEPLGLRAVPVKQDVLDEAEDDAAQFRELFGAMGTFGVLAGVLLLVNIFVMLAEERKSELGMLRAIGLRRASLVGLFSVEGWLYALAASAIGTFVGLALGRVIIAVIARIFQSDLEGFGLPLRFAAQRSSLMLGFALGLVIALVAVLLTSVRISRFNVIRAIRELPEPRVSRARLRGLVLGVVGTALGGAVSVGAVASGSPAARLLGPTILALGLGPLLVRWLPRRGVIAGASGLVLAWASLGFPATTELGEAGIQVFVLQGIVLTASAVVLVSQEHDVLERAARGLGVSRTAMAVRLGLAYPVARRFRTGLTLAMYALVIFTLTFVGVLGDVFLNQLDETAREISGGYGVFVRSNPTNPVAVEELSSVEGVAGVAPIATLEVDFRTEGVTDAQGWSVSGFDERLLAHGAPELEDRGEYPTDEAAYRAVLADPGLVLTDQFFLQEGGGPPEDVVEVGDRLTMVDPQTGTEREVVVAAQAADDFLFNGALYGIDHVRSFFGERAVANRAYVAVEGVEPGDVAARLAGRFVEQGAEADGIRDLLAQFLAVQNQFFQLFRGYLGFGLLVGIAGLGVVMVRAVRERRREIGVLRSLGFEALTVRRSFLFESAFVALEGTFIGVSLALVTAYNVLANTDAFGEGVAFTVSITGLASVVLGTLVASLLATAAPTRAAARVRPAVALRIAD